MPSPKGLSYQELCKMELFLQGVLKNAGEVDVCGLGCIIEPSGDGEGLFNRAELLLVSSHIKGDHDHKVSGLHRKRGRNGRSGADSALFQHQADGILCHPHSLIHRIALRKAALDVGDGDRITRFFGVEHRGIENSVHRNASLFLQTGQFEDIFLCAGFEVFGVERDDSGLAGGGVVVFAMRTVGADEHETVLFEQANDLFGGHWHEDAPPNL
nr:MAG TPA: hypothetical protein [Caudoviricetes sp.]